MKMFNALTAGIQSTNKSFRLIVLLYAVNILVAAAIAWGFQSVLAGTLGDSLSLERLVKDFDYTVYTDFMFKFGDQIGALLSQLWWLIASYILVNAFLGGGTIAFLANNEKPFSLRSYFENCGGFFLRFLRILLIFAAAMALVLFLSGILLGVIHSILSQGAVSEFWPVVSGIILVSIFLFIGMLLVMMADYAKVATVTEDAKSMFKSSWEGIKFVILHFLSTVGLQFSILVLTILGVVIYLLLEHQIGMATPITILVMFIIQQISVGFKVWTRVLTFAGDLQLYNSFKAERPAPVTLTPAVVAQPPVLVSAPAAAVLPEKPETKKRAPRRASTKRTTSPRRRTSKKSK